MSERFALKVIVLLCPLFASWLSSSREIELPSWLGFAPDWLAFVQKRCSKKLITPKANSEKFTLGVINLKISANFKKFYLTMEAICAKWSLLACSLLLARWLLRIEPLDKSLDARFNSDWCIAFLLAFALENLLFNSAGLELHGLEDK